jgi:hypothetical protein
MQHRCAQLANHGRFKKDLMALDAGAEVQAPALK